MNGLVTLDGLRRLAADIQQRGDSERLRGNRAVADAYDECAQRLARMLPPARVVRVAAANDPLVHEDEGSGQ